MTLIKVSNELNLIIKGNLALEIKGICSIASPKKNSIAYISDKKFLKNCIFSEDVAYLIDKSLESLFPKNSNLLITENIFESIPLLFNLFKPKKSVLKKISSVNGYQNMEISDFIFLGKDITIGENCSFGANVVIEDRVSIGNNVIIKNNVVICSDSIVGNNAVIENNSVIGSEGFGNMRSKDGSWVHIPHLGNVVICDNVSIGSNCSIDRATIDSTIIEKGVVIDNHIHIAHNVKIGEYTAIAAKVGIAGSCSIGKRNLIGGMVGIVDHISTCDDVIISATTTVHRNLTKPGVYSGFFPISDHSSWKRIAYWILKIDKIVKFLKIRKI